MTSTATKRFFLVGFMGAGKTTLGERVARDLSLPFFDLDGRIERAARMPIESIFALEGEADFRRRESEALGALLAEVEEGVIALGGGTFAIERNRRRVQQAGPAIWLDVPMDELLERIDGTARPLWKSAAEARALHAGRARAYAMADYRLDLGGLSTGEAQSKLFGLLSSLSGKR